MTVNRLTYPPAFWYFLYLTYNILSNIESCSLKKMRVTLKIILTMAYSLKLCRKAQKF